MRLSPRVATEQGLQDQAAPQVSDPGDIPVHQCRVPFQVLTVTACRSRARTHAEHSRSEPAWQRGPGTARRERGTRRCHSDGRARSPARHPSTRAQRWERGAGGAPESPCGVSAAGRPLGRQSGAAGPSQTRTALGGGASGPGPGPRGLCGAERGQGPGGGDGRGGESRRGARPEEPGAARGVRKGREARDRAILTRGHW